MELDMLFNRDFVSVKEYTLNYGHNGEHIKLIRTRFDINNKKIIKFYLIRLNLIELNNNSVTEISEKDVREVFYFYYPEIFDNIVNKFIEGL